MARRPALLTRATPFTRRLEQRAAEFIRKRHVFKEGESIVAGVSGGPDSTALLVMLARLGEEFGFHLAAAHFDHMLRSREEAECDREFVEATCHSLKVPFAFARGDVKRRVRTEKESVEEASRILRYRFLAAEAAKASATAVAVGHTLDDRAETVLLHLVRGAGLEGLAAMTPRAQWPFGEGPEIARPLLTITRAETERYCHDCGIEPRRDPTNDLPIATRNRVRHELLPLLETFNPRVAEALVRLADAAEQDAEFIGAEADWAWGKVARVGEGRVSMRRAVLGVLPPAVAIRLLRRAAKEAGANPEAVHLNEVMDSLDKDRSRISLPGGVALIEDAYLVIAGDEAPATAEPIEETVVSVPGRTRAGDWTIEADVLARDGVTTKPREGTEEATIAQNAIAGELVVRSRKPGDRLRPLGLGGSKKLQDILVDAKVPLEERDGLPVFADDEGVVWVAGHAIDERVALTPRTRRVLRLRVRRKPVR